MYSRFLNSFAPSIIALAAFTACCLMLCYTLGSTRDLAQATPEIVHKLLFWGALCLATMFVFVLCLARVTRYRRSLPDKRFSWDRNLR
jgi:hypothetical protein